ncbi:MAG TPA: glycoside hydrolase [Tepidisphaeraceae bacterium]
MRHLLPLAIVLVMSNTLFAAEHADVIDLSKQYQVIENFGASDCWTFQRLGGWSEASRNKVADLLFSTDKGIGLSLWRFNIGGGINHESINNRWRTAETFETAEGQYDWTRQANERWFARAAKERGVPYLLAFVNSPPGRMTRSGLTNSGSDKTSATNLKPDFEKQYARYLCDILQHFRETTDPKERLPFDYISPINEPQIEWAAGSQEGNRCSNEDIKRILIALNDELTARKLPVKIRAPESNTVPDLWHNNQKATTRYSATFGNYLEALCKDPAIAPLLDQTICYHNYGSGEGEKLVADHQMLGEKMKSHPGWKLWMSEMCVMSPRRDLGINMALDVARMIHADLVLSGASAWHWWLAVSNVDYKDGLLYTNWRRPGDEESILVSKTLWGFGNFSRFIRPGMRRVELTADGHDFKGLLGSAYIDPSSGKIVVVYVNSTSDAQRVRCEIKSVSGGTKVAEQFTPYVTSAPDDLAPKSAVSLSSGVELPPRSIVTLVSN